LHDNLSIWLEMCIDAVICTIEGITNFLIVTKCDFALCLNSSLNWMSC
jgi:hypothetical protein